MEIKFSHNYPKLHNQKSAKLIAVELKNRTALSDKFIEYDTSYPGGKYELQPLLYIILIFLGNDLIPFTTARPWNEEKMKHYSSNIGNAFDIIYLP